MENKFLKLKKEYLEKEYAKMNDMQQKAVFAVNGPLLILAGAGSGKTTVIVNRISYMVKYGDAQNSTYTPDSITQADIDMLSQAIENADFSNSDVISLVAQRPIMPWNILAITFTNKAANELKERLEKMLGETALDINAGTFHSICVRILRREIERLGYKKSFTIYDTADSTRVIKDAISSQGASEKVFAPKAVLSAISHFKDKMQTPQDALEMACEDFYKKMIAKIYDSYQQRLKSANALDFDDIIMLTVKLLSEHPDVLEYYQNRYKYILVDEYQDTNIAQYKLVSLLSQKHKNLCVVGDDDQSIYRFRGATIENILCFENQFDNATVIRLEQNYRSTQNILSSANAVIANNRNRKGKNLWTASGDGEKITVYRGENEFAEAQYVCDVIEENVSNGKKYSDHAVLYRTNAQSNNIERHLVRAGMPYRIIGGTKFFERKEIKDMISYLSVINNPSDIVRLKRIVNEPKRGIGDTTLEKAEQIAQSVDLTLFEVLKQSADFADLSRKSGPLCEFVAMIEHLQEYSETVSLDELLDELLLKTGYEDYLLKQGDEGKTRLENINELRTNLVKYEEENDEPSLSGFLEEVSLFTDLDNLNQSEDSVLLMTLHSAKGLEFPQVFIVGMEEGIFPSGNSFGDEDIEEERRLAYVGITRAKKKLHITNASERMLYGMTNRNRPSRFIGEIPNEYIDSKDATVRKSTTQSFGGSFTVSYGNAKPVPKTSFANVGESKPAEKAVVDYAVGDSVSHKIFGTGKVISMKPMANDILVEIEFEKAGTKKLMANFAKLSKV